MSLKRVPRHKVEVNRAEAFMLAGIGVQELLEPLMQAVALSAQKRAPVRKTQPWARKGRRTDVHLEVGIFDTETGQQVDTAGFTTSGEAGVKFQRMFQSHGYEMTGEDVIRNHPAFQNRQPRYIRNPNPKMNDPGTKAYTLATVNGKTIRRQVWDYKPPRYEFRALGSVSSRVTREIRLGRGVAITYEGGTLEQKRVRRRRMITGEILVNRMPMKVIPTIEYGGTLRKSILYEGVTGVSNSKMTFAVTAHAPYARWVEEGTRYMQAQPYLLPAFESVISKRLAR